MPRVTVRVSGPQGPGPLVFAPVTSAPTPAVRAEGLSELIGDIIINMTGGAATPPGQPLPTYNIQLSTSPSVSLTSRIVADNFLTEALLFIDDPAPGNQQPFIFDPLNPPPIINGVGGSGINYANPNAAVNGGQPIPNVFQGRRSDPNSIVWLGVPIDPPGTAAMRVFRITNVRANANQLGVSSPPGTSNLLLLMSIKDVNSSAPAIQLTGPTINLDRDPFGFSVERAGSLIPSFQQCLDRQLNPGQPDGLLRWREGFPSSFRPRNAGTTAQNPGGTAPQNQLGTNYPYQSGFYNPSLSSANGLNQTGLADHGTRLMARFNNIPAGVQLFVAESIQNGALQIRMTANPDGPFALPPADGLPGLQEVPIIGGTGQAVWEIVNSDTNSLESIDIPVYFAWVANTASNLPSLGTSTVNGSLAPLSTASSSPAAAPIPRFADSGVNRSLLTINAQFVVPVRHQSIGIRHRPRDREYEPGSVRQQSARRSGDRRRRAAEGSRARCQRQHGAAAGRSGDLELAHRRSGSRDNAGDGVVLGESGWPRRGNV
jgi:hypothetical protein